jgi:hypothetical protein
VSKELERNSARATPESRITNHKVRPPELGEAGAKLALPRSMSNLIRCVTVALAVTAGMLSTRQLPAQLPIPSFGIAGGVSHYNLSGTGTAPIGAVRIDIPLASLIAEGSLAAFRPSEQNGVRRTYIIPEAQLQFQIVPVIVRPYIGIGAGRFRAVSGPDPRPNDLTLSASAGIRAGLPVLPFGLRAEVRVRGIGSGFSGGAAEWTIGITK